MSGELLNEGRPIVVTTPRDRIGHGPWARLLASAVVPDEGSAVAQGGRALARGGSVHTVELAEGTLGAVVAGDGPAACEVTLSAEPVPPRIWAVVSRSGASPRASALRGANVPDGRASRFDEAVAGREQSVQLEHQMTVDWEQPLVPRARSIARSCTCDAFEAAGACEHVAALAYVFADAIDSDPSVLLRWRGCVAKPDADGPVAAEEDEPAAEPELLVAVVTSDDLWQAGRLPVLRPLRPLPVGAVLKSLGRSGLRVGSEDLSDVLLRAYASLAAPSRE